MARKKRKAAKQPAALSRPVARWESAAPWLGVLAFCASFFAMLGGVSDGTLDLRRIFDYDTLRPHMVYADLFLTDEHPASGWQLRSENPHWFPEFALVFAAMALEADIRLFMYLGRLLEVGAAAWGWMKLCDLLYGKSPARRLAVWLLHALAFLVLAWRGEDILGLHLAGLFHYGAWLAMPWLLWLSLLTLDGDFSSRKSWAAGFGLLSLLFVVTASDLITLVWFTLPAALTALLTAWPLSPSARRGLFVFLFALGVGTALDYLLPETLSKLSPTTGGFAGEASVKAFRLMMGHLGDIAARNPLEAAVWLAFAGIAAWRTLWVVSRLEIFRGKSPPKPRGAMHALFGVPQTRAHRFVAVFVSASAVASMGAVIYSGNVIPNPFIFWSLDRTTRHVLPFVYFPLFAGWALLPWKFSAPPSMRPLILAAAGALAASGVKAAAMDWKKLDPFGTPFQECFVENARRLGWKSGVSILYYASAMTDPRFEGNMRLAPTWVGRFHDGKGGIIHRVTAHSDIVNRNYWRGDIQFVMLNMSNGLVWSRPPRPEDAGCSARHPDYLECVSSFDVVMDESAARTFFGEPTEVIECDAGGAFFHYDPPLRFNPPEEAEQFRKWAAAPKPVTRR